MAETKANPWHTPAARRRPEVGARDWQCQPFGTGGKTVSFYRGKFSSRAYLLKLGGSESTSSSVVRQSQFNLQEAYSCRTARVVRGRTAAAETTAVLDSRGLPATTACPRPGSSQASPTGSLLPSAQEYCSRSGLAIPAECPGFGAA